MASSNVISIVSIAVFSLPSSAVSVTVYIPSEVKNDWSILKIILTQLSDDDLTTVCQLKWN